MKLYSNTEGNPQNQDQFSYEEKSRMPNSFEIFKHYTSQNYEGGGRNFYDQLPEYIKQQQNTPVLYYKPPHIKIEKKQQNPTNSEVDRSVKRSSANRKKIFQEDSLRIKLKEALVGQSMSNQEIQQVKSRSRGIENQSNNYQQNSAELAQEAFTQSMKPEVRSKMFANNNPQYQSSYQIPTDLPRPQKNDSFLFRQAMGQSAQPEMRQKLFNTNNNQLPHPNDVLPIQMNQAIGQSVRPETRSKLFQNQNTHKYFPQYVPEGSPLNMIASNISNIPFRPDNSQRPNLSFGTKRNQASGSKFVRALDKQRTQQILSNLILAEDNQKFTPPPPSEVTDNVPIKNKSTQNDPSHTQDNQYLKLIPEILTKINKNQTQISELRAMMKKLVDEEKNRDEAIQNYMIVHKNNLSSFEQQNPRSFANQQPLPDNPHSDYHYNEPQTPKLRQQLSAKSSLQRQQMRRLELLIQQNKHLCRKVMEQRLRNSSSELIDLSKSCEQNRSRPQQLQQHRYQDQQLNNLDISIIPPIGGDSLYNSKKTVPLIAQNPPKITITTCSKNPQQTSIPITPGFKRVSQHRIALASVPRTKIY